MLFIEIIGNLGSDPEQRYTQDGKSMVSVRVAVNSRRKNADGDQVERTDWFRARIGGGRADYVVRELHKGSRVLVRGRLRSASGPRARASSGRRTTSGPTTS